MTNPVDMRIKVTVQGDDQLQAEWVKLWNCSSDIFTLLLGKQISAEQATPLTLMAFARAMANESEVPAEVAWLNLMADPKFKAAFLAAFNTQQEFSRHIAEVRSAVEEEEPPAVRH